MLRKDLPIIGRLLDLNNESILRRFWVTAVTHLKQIYMVIVNNLQKIKDAIMLKYSTRFAILKL